MRENGKHFMVKPTNLQWSLTTTNDKVQKYINVLRHKEYTKDYISWLQCIHVLHVIDIDGLCKRELNRKKTES